MFEEKYGRIFVLDFAEKISLKDIYNSGQCFRWKELYDDTYRIIAGEHLADVSQDGQKKIKVRPWKKIDERAFSAEITGFGADSGVEKSEEPKNGEQTFWADYFDKGTSYQKIREHIPSSDAYLQKAAQTGAGIRILRQDPWEMIVTFIISQRKNIPAIRTCVEKLCRVAGTKMIFEDVQEPVYKFPTAEEVAGIFCCKAEGLAENGTVHCSFKRAGYDSCSLGYRMPYIRDAARWMQKNSIEDLQNDSDSDLFDRLMEIKGVGVKVASCIMLFGFHRLKAFPVDVWMNRVLEKYYPDGFDLEKYAPYAGVMQQYLFYQIRNEEKA